MKLFKPSSRQHKAFLRTVSLLLVMLLAQSFCVWPQSAYARNGYSQPGSSSYSAPSSGYSGNGGYSRPSGSSGGNYGSWNSAGDTAISRRNSAQALQGYRSSTAPAAPAWNDQRRPSVGYDNGGNGFFGNAQRRPQTPAGYGSNWGQPGTYAQPPAAYMAGPSRFGAWDAMMLWALLSSVNTQRSSDFFAQNQTDPGYLQWRSEADRLAANNPDLQAKLAQLDQQLAKTPPNAAVNAGQGSAELEGNGMTMLIIVIAAAVFIGLWVMRQRAGARPAAAPTKGAAGITGSAQMRFRVGMTMPLDPTPFILSAGVTKVVSPPEGNLVSIEAVGLVSDSGGAMLHRLYLAGREGFFVLHLNAVGQPDECRYFSVIDQVSPANQEDWAFWLDPAQGMIGWPEFQTKDGTLYGRVWASGSARVPPRDQTETIRDLSGDHARTLHAMLYGRHTNAPPPAAATEYILVTAVEQDGAAWVEVHAGIDVNPAALTLPAIAFD